MTENKRNQLLADWDYAEKQLSAAKEREKSLRLAVHAEFFDSEEKAGTYKEKLGQGWQLKLTCKDNVKVDEPEIVQTMLTELAKLEGGSDAAKDLFKWKPTLSQTAYKKLSLAHKQIVDSVLTVSPGLPAIELFPPKDAK